MSYPCEWIGNEEHPGGVAVFVVEGVRYEFALTSFTVFQNVSKMLDAVFDQGKTFGFDCTKAALDRALTDAKVRHSL